jgi:GntR family transcriptional regulator, galactonate operon transcriptional repressor
MDERHEFHQLAQGPPFRNLQGHLLQQLGQWIVSGGVAPGEALPTEPEIAAEFQVSKTVVREAIRGLAAKGMVQARTRLGTRVRPREDWHVMDPDLLTWQLGAEPDQDFMRDFEEFRHAVEPTAARIAAQRARPVAVRGIQAALERMRASTDDPDEYFTADLDFHVAILTATDNRLLRGLRDAVRAALTVRHTNVAAVVHDMKESLPYHERLAAAISGGQADEAVAAVHDLLALTERDDARLAGRRRRQGNGRLRGGS